MSRIIPPDLSRFFELHPTLETERLRLRELTTTDVPDLHAYYSDPETALYVPFTAFTSIADTEKLLGRVANGFERKESFMFGVERKSDGKIIGISDLFNLSSQHLHAVIGWGLAKSYWGFGYMTEAVREVIRFAFEEMGMHRIEAECETENIRSIRVAERCGMTLEATRVENEINKGRFVSNYVYAIVRE
ncbi:MAG TPA: GNAT family N-acetyltransferase [Candidatus Kapabacteria bacterium]|nr:GNAT family N-acetyltransferase [Candidatus Kapabacteria bacterium]